MESDTSENYEDFYTEEDAQKHEKLVDKVLRLNKTQHIRKPSRTEPTLQISEFNLVKSSGGDKGSVEINDLTKSLRNRKSRLRISENVKRAHKASHTLPKPLEKPQANKIRRTVAYEKTRLELDRWEATVTANRVSTNLSFPLNDDVKMDQKESENFASMWRVKSKLAEELEKHEPTVEEYHISLEQEEFPLTMKEMLARRKEAAKLRAYQGYKEAKARRQNKIKSKKYHRIQKREKIKKKLKEFEQLQKTNPEEALKKLEEIEKSRIEERFSLRHKSTGKWARNQQIRAKYDKESRQNLAQQLTLSRDLTQKSKTNGSSSEEEDEDVEKAPMGIDETNPWVNGVKPGKEVADFISGYRKYWLEQNKTAQKSDAEKTEDVLENSENVDSNLIKLDQPESNKNVLLKKKKQKVVTSDLSFDVEETVEKLEKDKKVPQKKKKQKRNEQMNNSKSTSEWEVSLVENGEAVEDMFKRAENKLKKKMLRNVKQLKKKLVPKTLAKLQREVAKDKVKVDLSLPIQKKTPQIDEALIENIDAEIRSNEELSNLKTILSSQTKQKPCDIDPEKYLKINPTNLATAIPNIVTNEEVDDQRAVISEAFEDDDIVDEFNKDKSNEADKDKPKNINLTLPGWGSWGGTGVKVNKRKKRRFTLKAPKKIPRKDDNKGFLIINESAQNKVKEHMVSEVPFPFKTVKDFEASVRAPISNTFMPETAYKKLIKPAVTTKMGTIIEPMSKDLLLNKNS
ncbi:U3 small nucleolar RNA-associated protein 14 homolog A-like [Zophobas morio]|uniref:U3 small nucleolar RNA-associated protein 14 homolog A-like n=1 Tax=Zophobas morio TaxID=2755281 RepID=UPI003083BBAD